MLIIKTKKLVNIIKQIFIVGTIYTYFFWCTSINHPKLIFKFSSDGLEAELIETRKDIIKFETQETQEVRSDEAEVSPCLISNVKHGKYKKVTVEVKCFLINVFKEVFDSLFCYRDDFS